LKSLSHIAPIEDEKWMTSVLDDREFETMRGMDLQGHMFCRY